ncbi:MAG: MarR family winged helix-turn-helix transcriptional regulator [Acidiferrobacterales bacterium]
MGKNPHKLTVPGVGEGKRGEQGHIGYLLRQANATHRLRMERALAELGVTLPQFSVLTMLTAYPGASGADLARLSLLTPQTMSVIVANLERAGAVSRHPHAVHGRIQHIEVTKGGRRLLAKCRTRVKAVEEELLAGVCRADERVIRRWLVNAALHNSAG